MLSNRTVSTRSANTAFKWLFQILLKLVSGLLLFAILSSAESGDDTLETDGKVELAPVVARILTQAPDLFLLDEPTNHLDPRHQVHVLNLCKTIWGQGKTVITAIHDLNLASMYAHQLLLLKDGSSVACGPPEAVLTLDQLSETYGIPFEVLSHPNGYLWVMPSLNVL